MLEERKLQEEQVALNKVIGFDKIVYSHQDVALSVVSGMETCRCQFGIRSYCLWVGIYPPASITIRFGDYQRILGRITSTAVAQYLGTSPRPIAVRASRWL